MGILGKALMFENELNEQARRDAAKDHEQETSSDGETAYASPSDLPSIQSSR